MKGSIEISFPVTIFTRSIGSYRSPFEWTFSTSQFLHWSEISLPYGLLPIREFLVHLIEEHASIDVAQRIAGEVAEHPSGPMDVLHQAFRVVLDVYPQILGVLLVPDLRELVHRCFPVEYRLLYLEPDYHVKAIGHFVSLCPDLRRFDIVDGEDEIRQLHASECFSRDPPQFRQRVRTGTPGSCR